MLPCKLIPSTLETNRLIEHFTRDIVGEDRRLRFGNPVKDEMVTHYIKGSLEGYGSKNMWFVVYEIDTNDINERCFNAIVASCHVAYNKKTRSAELGLTVSPKFRNEKLGQELFNRGVTWARACGAESVFMNCLSENKAIQHIANKSGMTVVTIDHGEKEATIKVNKNSIAAGFEDSVMEQMAIYDTIVRKQKWFFDNFMKSFGVK